MPLYTLRQATEADQEFLCNVVFEAMAPVRLSNNLANNATNVVDMEKELAEYKAKYPPEKVQVIVFDGKDVGRLRVVRSEKEIYIGGIQLLPEFQGKGIGSTIVQDIINESDVSNLPIMLEVHVVNIDAQEFYKKLGFAVVEQKKDQYILRYMPQHLHSTPPTLYIMVGVGFSGKSTLSKKIVAHTGATLVSQDALWFEKEKELNLEQDSDKQWNMIQRMCEERIVVELKKGNSVVYDNTNLDKKYRQTLRDLAQSAGAHVKVVYLDTSEEIQTARQEVNRISKDRHDVKQEYLDQAKRDLQIPTEDEHAYFYTPDADVEEFIQKVSSRE